MGLKYFSVTAVDATGAHPLLASIKVFTRRQELWTVRFNLLSASRTPDAVRGEKADPNGGCQLSGNIYELRHRWLSNHVMYRSNDSQSTIPSRTTFCPEKLVEKKHDASPLNVPPVLWTALTVPFRLFLTCSYTDVCFRDRATNRAKISAFYFWYTIHDPFCRVFTSSARLRNILEYRVRCDAFISWYFDAVKCV